MPTTWKEKLAPRTEEGLAREIDIFETQIELRKQGKLDEKIFAEARLRRGAYGQRYDNGQRHDGIRTQEIPFPTSVLKGPETFFDAPGMIRIKVPYGGMNAEQLEAMADIAEEYSGGVLHVTTRQDIQMHYLHIESMPNLMRRLAAVGITTREACGNSVRNVTACPLSGVCRDESFDVTPYAQAIMKFLLGHPDTQDFGRKFKIAFSGCKQHACGLTNMHDMGAIAVVREVNGKKVRGFELYVGGGLGAVPHEAKLFDEFVTEEELLPVSQAISRVFARLGEKKNRQRARIKFLVAGMGIEAFRAEVLKEKAIMPKDPAWTAYLSTLHEYSDGPSTPGVSLNGAARPAGFDTWYKTNVYRQLQPGYVAVTVTLPLGDASAPQTRVLADMARKYSHESVRATVDQNLLFRWVSEDRVIDFYNDLEAIGLNESGAGTIVDVTACPGTDSCKLGISSSRGLAGELRRRLGAKNLQIDESLGNLHIKISGCFNSCGQHHIADLGFYGVNRSVKGFSVPHFQVILGGKWVDNGGAYGLAIAAVPSRNIPELVDRVTGRFASDRSPGETFQGFIARIGKRALKEMFEDLCKVPEHEADKSYYTDWGDSREYTHGDRGKGECAGEVVSLVDFTLADAEREAFEAQILLDEGKLAEADAMAYQAMVSAAKALVKIQWLDVPNEPGPIAEEFRKRFYDTEVFFDRFVKGKFAVFFFKRHERGDVTLTKESVHQLAEETVLFIEAAHACQARMQQAAAPVKA